MDGDVLRLGWPCFSSKRFGLSEEIPRVFFTVSKLTVDCMCCLCVAMFE